MSFKRKLSLFDATMLVVGNVVGAGIFTTAGFIAGELHNSWLFLGVWVVGGLLTLCGALTYAEMTSMYPRSGGDYLYLKEAYGSCAGYLVGWISFWIINPGSIALLSLALAKYLMGALGHPGILGEKLVSMGAIIFFTLINRRGVRLSGTTQNLWTLGSLAILLFFIAVGLGSGRGDWGHLARAAGGALPLSSLLGPAMVAVIFSYSGWFITAYIGDEVIRPERNLPRSLALGTLIVTALYVAINIVYLYALPFDALKGVVNVGHAASGRLLSTGFVHVITLAIMLAIAASINATVLAGARLPYAIAKDGFFSSHFEKLHARHGTPHIALIIQGVLACIYVAVDTFENLLSAVVFVMILSSIAAGLAHLILRQRRPQAVRPFRTPGYPWVPLLFIASYAYLAFRIFSSNPIRSIFGVVITLSGLPFYLFALRRQRICVPDVAAGEAQ